MNILFANGHSQTTQTTQDMLEQLGHCVTCVSDPKAALSILQARATEFDCILVDQDMSGREGVEFLSTLHTHPRLRTKPVLVLSQDVQPEHIAASLSAGACLYLIKPAPKTLIKAALQQINTVLQERQALENLLQETRGGLALTNYAQFAFKNLLEARMLSAVLAEMSKNPEKTLVGYSELLVNAVEHGNLEITYLEKSALLQEGRLQSELERRMTDPVLGARQVFVTAQRQDRSLLVRIEDQGAGFDWLPFLDFAPERAFDLHGRGIAISKHLAFDELHYQGKGNTVEVRVFE